MGYPVQANAPRVSVNGRTFAVGVFPWDTPIGSMKKVGVYEQMPNGEWNEALNIATYANGGDMLKDLQAKGGVAKYMTFIIAAVNAYFARLFGTTPTPVPTTEPTTDAEALEYVAARMGALKFSTVNGVPVLA